MKKYVIEFIGTFFLVLTVAFTGNPFAIAAILVSMIYMGGYISGAHYNPAVTLAVLIRGKVSWIDALVYWLVQFLGAFSAALVYFSVSGKYFIPRPSILATFQTAILMEALYTFALASVVLHVATADETENNQYYGLAIGFVILAGAFAGGLSGGVYNPAVGIGPLLANISNIGVRMQSVWIYLIGPLSGGLLAGLLFRLLNIHSTPKVEKEKK